MNELSRRVGRLASGAPIGYITPIGSGRYGRDDAGRLFVYSELERYEAGRKRKQRERDKRNFSFGHMRYMREITAELSNKYCGYILLLQPYIAFKTNVLVTEGRDEHPLTIDDLARIWDVSKRTARTVVDELELRSIMFDDGEKFTVNERYHFRRRAGSEVDALIKTYFTALKSFHLSAADLGFVYKLLPYVHYETNLVCSDPFARPHDIRFLNDREIGDIVGLSESKAKEAIARLRKARIIGEWINVEDKRQKFTALNPYVFCRKSGEPDGAIAALFASWIRK